MVQRAQKKALRIINFKEERHPSVPITLNNSMLVFDHLNSSLPAIFNVLFERFKYQHGNNTGGARRCF